MDMNPRLNDVRRVKTEIEIHANKKHIGLGLTWVDS